MFGIGGGELIFILFIVLMLFGSDKIPDIARTMGKTMAQLRNATNDIKSEIHKGMEENGIKQSMDQITGNINAEIEKAKQNIIGDTPTHFTQLQDDIVQTVQEPATQTKQDLEDMTGPIKRQHL